MMPARKFKAQRNLRGATHDAPRPPRRLRYSPCLKRSHVLPLSYPITSNSGSWHRETNHVHRQTLLHEHNNLWHLVWNKSEHSTHSPFTFTRPSNTQQGHLLPSCCCKVQRPQRKATTARSLTGDPATQSSRGYIDRCFVSVPNAAVMPTRVSPMRNLEAWCEKPISNRVPLLGFSSLTSAASDRAATTSSAKPAVFINLNMLKTVLGLILE